MPDLLDAIRVEAAEAKTDPAALAMFKSLRLNLGTWDTTRAFLIDHDAWARAEGDMPRTGELVMGLDLGSGASMSAVAACWAGTGRLACISAFPSQPSLGERGLADGVGGLYHAANRRPADARRSCCANRPAPGSGVFALRIPRRHSLRPLARSGIAGCAFVDRREHSSRYYSRPGGSGTAAKMCVVSSAQFYPGKSGQKSLLLRSAMAEAVTVSDPAGNRKITKRRDRSRDDAAVAACLAGAHVHRLLSAPVEDGPGFVRAAI